MTFPDFPRGRGPRHPQAEAFLTALADEGALRLLGLLAARPTSARDVAACLGMPLATAYRHLHRLEAGGLVQVERSAFTREGKRYELYRATVQDATVRFCRGEVSVSWGAEPSPPTPAWTPEADGGQEETAEGR